MIKPTIWNFLILIFICQSISEPLNDSCPRLIRKTTEICNQSLGPKSVIDYKYDAKGRNCYIVKYYGHSLYKELYEYDRKDRLVKQINMKNGKITTTKRIEYNAEGKKLKVTVYDSSEALTNIKYHYYDIKSKRVTINEFIPDSP